MNLLADVASYNFFCFYSDFFHNVLRTSWEKVGEEAERSLGSGNKVLGLEDTVSVRRTVAGPGEPKWRVLK